MAIVLPDSILTNPGLTALRRWILSKARVVASVDLPKETFQPHTGTQTSVLLLQKKTEDEMDAERAFDRHREYEVFLAMPRAVGHESARQPPLSPNPGGGPDRSGRVTLDFYDGLRWKRCC